ncbi:Divalent-cation tolerance protein CutA [Neorhodopirellula pilleata]|uniref:Divalent-cation tolerance protein CutA n=2 Tax=Neorhodopirellula pilleata TaxID=2714738 RepID=A0A5C6AN72_9BACT|nr:Divalent-cation tolerance protein CutA [Neorhodopirellula pilleata]
MGCHQESLKMTQKSTSKDPSQVPNPGSLAIVWTTTADAEQAQSIAGELVQRRLAACVQTDGPIRSTYVWKEEMQVENEYRLAIKTTSEKVADVIDWLAQNHPYEEPEILVTPVTETSPGYLSWAAAQTS